MSSRQVIEKVRISGLRGRGGAGFPTWKKWELASNVKSEEKYLVCNGDEGDPGAFMDRAVLEGDPHSVIEGMLISAYATGATKGFLYVRAEYPIAVEHLGIALEQAKTLGLVGENILGSGFSFDISIKEGAGAFVCGEETALIASIKGKRGMPRPRPPFPVESGLYGKPTCINNVETLANIAPIILNGGVWYAKIGTEKSKGTKVFALAGKVNNTGLVEVPMGITLRKIVFDIGGGIPDGKQCKAVQTGGPSGGCIPTKELDTMVDYDSLEKLGAIMGSGGLIVADENTCMVDLARFFMDFIQDESCGKCVPCRIGTKRMLEMLERITQGKGEVGDIEKLEMLAKIVKDSSLCGLGQTAPNPILSTIRYFRDEYESHIIDKRCRSSVCESLFTSPCQNTCPVELDVPGYINFIKEGKYEEAVKLIREKLPFPAVCGRICHHPCERRCRRGEIDKAVAICALKRAATDYAKHYKPVRHKIKGIEVAIIGAGPAGLTCAFELAKLGYAPVVFESLPKPGGMLRVGIPDYRLPKNILDEEIKWILCAGIKIKTNTRIGKDIKFKALLKKYRATFIAVGAHSGYRLGIPGEDKNGVAEGIGFLRNLNLGKKQKVGNVIAIIGGGNVAIDAARSSLRSDAKKVYIIYRRTKSEMPAMEEEIEEAIKEGIEIIYLASPKRILGENGKVEGIECLQMELGDYDESGRRKPMPIKSSEFTLEVDMVIPAIGQKTDFSFLPEELQSPDKINWRTLATPLSGVFMGGDCRTGPATAIEAIAAGKKAAKNIDKFLRGEKIEEVKIFVERPPKRKRVEEPSSLYHQRIAVLPLSQRKNFKEVELGLTKTKAKLEATRCLRCDLEE